MDVITYIKKLFSGPETVPPVAITPRKRRLVLVTFIFTYFCKNKYTVTLKKNYLLTIILFLNFVLERS